MSLEAELAELSVGYHSLLATNKTLQEHIKQLEGLLYDYMEFVDDEKQSLGTFREKRDVLEQRAKELLSE